MRQWLVVVPPDRYGAERLYHHDTLELSGGDQAELALGDRVVLAAGDPLVVFGLGRVTGTVAGDESDPDDPDAPEAGEGERGISYTHRLLDEPVPWGGAVARPGKPLPLTEAEFGALLARVSPDRAVTAPRRSWLVGVELPTEIGDAGWVRRTADADALIFPRTDPAVIVLVNDGVSGAAGRALLGRGATWPEGRFSCLAGFVEPGESAEATVAREVYEEV